MEAFHRDIFGFLSRIAAKYGDVAAFDLGDRSCVLINRSDLVRTLFSRHEADLRKPNFLKDSNRGHWADGLTTLDMLEWRERRPPLRPAFRHDALLPRLEITRECTLDMIAGWHPGAVLDLKPELRLLAARLAVRSVLDAEVACYGEPASRSGVIPMDEAMGEDFRAVGVGYGDERFEMVRPRAGPDMRQTVAIIDARLAGGAARGDVLSCWLTEIERAGQVLDRDTVRGEIIQMLFAAHLTLPLSMISCWRALAQHGDINTRIAAEADGMDWSRPDIQQILRQSFAMATVQEALRLMPPAPILYREVTNAFDLGGFRVEQGVAVWVAPRLLHHDPRYFANPTVFDPLRFGSGGLANQSMSAYLPFGTGPRTCIASRQSFLQLAMILLLVAERFRLVASGRSADVFQLEVRGS